MLNICEYSEYCLHCVYLGLGMAEEPSNIPPRVSVQGGSPVICWFQKPREYYNVAKTIVNHPLNHHK